MYSLIRLAMKNKYNPLMQVIVFDKNVATAMGLKMYARTTGHWDFKAPIVVDARLVKEALAIGGKEPVWEGDMLNGVRLVSRTNFLDFEKLIFPITKGAQTRPILFTQPFQKIFKCIKPAIAKNDIRYCLNGIFFSPTKGQVVATDGHRLHAMNDAIYPAGMISEPDFIVARELFDNFNVTAISRCGEYVVAHAGDVTVAMKPVEGVFLDYSRVIPQPHLRPLVEPITKDRIAIMRRIQIFQNVFRKKLPSFIVRTDGNIIITNDDGSEVAKWDFWPSNQIIDCVAFRPGYMHDALLAAGEGGTIALAGRNDTALITSSDGNFKAVVMPQRF